MSSDPYTLSRSELVNKHHQLEREGRYQEKHLCDAIEFLLREHTIPFEREYRFPSDPLLLSSSGKGNAGHRVDFYLPDCDAAVEVKSGKPSSFRGLGQAKYYSLFASESLLISEELHRPSYEAVQSMPNVSYGVVDLALMSDKCGIEISGAGNSQFVADNSGGCGSDTTGPLFCCTELDINRQQQLEVADE